MGKSFCTHEGRSSVFRERWRQPGVWHTDSADRPAFGCLEDRCGPLPSLRNAGTHGTVCKGTTTSRDFGCTRMHSLSFKKPCSCQPISSDCFFLLDTLSVSHAMVCNRYSDRCLISPSHNTESTTWPRAEEPPLVSGSPGHLSG